MERLVAMCGCEEGRDGGTVRQWFPSHFARPAIMTQRRALMTAGYLALCYTAVCDVLQLHSATVVLFFIILLLCFFSFFVIFPVLSLLLLPLFLIILLRFHYLFFSFPSHYFSSSFLPHALTSTLVLLFLLYLLQLCFSSHNENLPINKWPIHNVSSSSSHNIYCFLSPYFCYPHNFRLLFSSFQLLLFFSSLHCCTPCGILSPCSPSPPDCNAAVFLLFSYFPLHPSLWHKGNCQGVDKNQNCYHFTAPPFALLSQHADDKIN
jgi:hypothetical protein